MLRLLSDEDVHDDIIRGLRRREPILDIVRAVDVGLDHTADPLILEWAGCCRAGPCLAFLPWWKKQSDRSSHRRHPARRLVLRTGRDQRPSTIHPFLIDA
jgi:hypothetical protein